MYIMEGIEEGYLYIAKGAKYIDEAINSAKSLRNVDKNAHITLITENSFKQDVFDKLIINKSENYNHKEGFLYNLKN